MDKEKLKKIFGIDQKEQIIIKKVSNGFNIRLKKRIFLKKKEKDNFTKILIDAGQDQFICKKCGKVGKCHPHHIIYKSKCIKNRDHSMNGIFICFDCHIGNNGIHSHKWKIEEIIDGNVIKKIKNIVGIYVDEE